MVAQIFNFRGWVAETRPDFLVGKYAPLLRESGFNIINRCEHFFEPFGFTALFLLGESHFAIHTFPECGKTYIELSSCVETPFLRFKADAEKDLLNEI